MSGMCAPVALPCPCLDYERSFLGPNPTIASLSLGSPRDFQMRHKTDKAAKVEKWSLQSGSHIP